METPRLHRLPNSSSNEETIFGLSRRLFSSSRRLLSSKVCVTLYRGERGARPDT